MAVSSVQQVITFKRTNLLFKQKVREPPSTDVDRVVVLVADDDGSRSMCLLAVATVRISCADDDEARSPFRLR